ncbi:MAG: flagellar filament capping protein FliD [Sulfuricella sp.]|nr:flagellar filament capping protein FliD [Sulfuricella sp.]
MLGMVSSLYGNAYNQYGALNTLAGMGQLSSIGSGSSVTALNRQESSYQVKLSAYGKLQSSLDTFKTALSNFKTAQDTAPFKAASGTAATLSAKASKDVANAGSYSINVSQLAKAQTLASNTVTDKDSTIVGTGSINIQIGAYNGVGNTFTPSDNSGGKTISISAGNGTLSGIANAINAADAGVKASVVQVSGGYQLSLASTKTGTDNTIKLTASDNDNSDSDLAGLSALAYDPTKGPSGYTKNLSETTAAQNAQLTVNGAAVVSQSNSVTSAVSGVTLDLNTTGTSNVTVSRDAAAFASSAQKLVDAYNALQKSVGELSTGYAAPLGSDALLARVGGDIGNTLAQASYGYGNDQIGLANIGITKQSDGTLALDKTKLQSAFAANPDNAAKLLANTADQLSATAARDNSSTSQLQYTTRTLNKALQSVQTRKALLQDYTSQNYFGLPTQPPLSSYIPKSNATAQAGRYTQISSLF